MFCSWLRYPAQTVGSALESEQRYHRWGGKKFHPPFSGGLGAQDGGVACPERVKKSKLSARRGRKCGGIGRTWSNLPLLGAGRRLRCATTIIRGEMANFGEEGPLRRRATREVAHPPGTILPRLTVTEHRDFENLTFVPKP